MSVIRDDCPSRGRIFTRPGDQGRLLFYVEVAEVGVLVVSAVGRPIDGRLQPQGEKLLSLGVLERLAHQQTPLPPPPEEPEP